MANDLLDKISRRNFVKTSGTGALAALAGCSTQDGSSADTTTSNDDSTSTQAEGTESSGDGTINDTGDATGKPENTQSGETVYPGEEAIESAYGELGAFWIQFNDTGSQLETPYESSLLNEVPGGYDLENQTFTGDGGTTEWDILYVAISPEHRNDDGEYSTEISSLNSEIYDEDKSYEQNRGNGAIKRGSTGYAGEEEIEVFFEEDVNSYSDIIEDIPDELDEFV